VSGDRYERGEQLLRKIDGDKVADNLIARYENLAPDFTRSLVEFAFGEIYAREGDFKHREIVAISSLATIGGCDSKSMGARPYVRRRLLERRAGSLEIDCVGRPYRAGPSEGYPGAHAVEQDRIIKEALTE
jgi:2-oxoglutarate dehydrogenase complex dehydrogenase (E1) component-like enzyme